MYDFASRYAFTCFNAAPLSSFNVAFPVSNTMGGVTSALSLSSNDGSTFNDSAATTASVRLMRCAPGS